MKVTIAGLAAICALVLGLAPGMVTVSGARAQGVETELVIAGVVLKCDDYRGAPVRTTRMDDLGDVARAWIISRMPIITIDTARMAKLPEKVQLFFYLHECGHHQLAHIYVPTTTSENEADCWAVKKGRREAVFTRADVAGFAPVFAHSRGSASGHLPGPERVAHLLACFDDPSETVEQPEAAQGITVPRSLAGGG